MNRYCAVCRQTVDMASRHVELEAETVGEDAPEEESYLVSSELLGQRSQRLGGSQREPPRTSFGPRRLRVSKLWCGPTDASGDEPAPRDLRWR